MLYVLVLYVLRVKWNWSGFVNTKRTIVLEYKRFLSLASRHFSLTKKKFIFVFNDDTQSIWTSRLLNRKLPRKIHRYRFLAGKLNFNLCLWYYYLIHLSHETDKPSNIRHQTKSELSVISCQLKLISFCLNKDIFIGMKTL